MKYQLIISVYAFIFLLSLVTPQFIVTANDYQTVMKSIVKDFQTALNDTLFTNLKDGGFIDMFKDDIVATNITTTSVNITPFDDCNGNLNTNLFIISPDKVSVSFDYNYKIADREDKPAKLTISIFEIKIELKSNEDNTSPVINVKMDFQQTGFVISNAATPEDEASLQVFFFGGRIYFTEKFIAGITKSIADYQQNKLASIKPFTFVSNSLLGKRTITINLKEFVGFCIEKTKMFFSAICYYSGNASDKVDRTVKDEVFDYYEYFDFFSNYKRIFINFKMFSDIFAKMTQDNPVVVTLDQNSVIAKDLPYQLTVSSLKQYFTDEILKDYADTDTFTVTTLFKDIILRGGKEINTAKMSSSINIKDQPKVISFDYDAKFFTNYQGSDTLPQVNFCLIAFANMKNLTISPDNAIKNLEAFQKAIINTLALGYRPEYQVCISDDGINLQDYLKGGIYRFLYLTNGLYIEGTDINKN